MEISVIIPIYNTELWLKDCLDSVVKQTHKFKEIVLVNDGSTDGSLSICEEYERQYPNIQLISQENQRQGAARNHGMKYVSGDYVMFVDSDDFIKKNTVEKLLVQLAETNLDIIYFDADVQSDVGTYKNTYDRKNKISEVEMAGYEFFSEIYPYEYVVSPCMAVFRTAFLREQGITFPEKIFFEDETFSFSAMTKAKRVKYFSEKLYVRRYRANSVMTSEFSIEKYYDLRKNIFLCWEMISSLAFDSASEGNAYLLYMMRTYLLLRSRYFNLCTNVRERESEISVLGNTFCNFIERIPNISIKYNDLSIETALKFVQFFYLWKTKNEKEIFRNTFRTNETIKIECRDYYIELLQVWLRKLPLGEKDKRVGVYGTGKHTEHMLEWYQKVLGDINCKLYFIDTFKESFSEKYKEKEILNIKDVGEYIEAIILSSSLYEDEMYATVRRMYGEEIKIYRFYDVCKEDIFNISWGECCV